MPTIKLRYEFPGTLHIDQSRFGGEYDIPAQGPERDAVAIVNRSISESFAPLVAEHITSTTKILILADDISRPTRTDTVVPTLISQLRSAGASQHRISFLMALGTHRPMTDQEVGRKLGTSVASEFAWQNHAWDDPSALVNLGSATRGIDVHINRAVPDADVVIGLGHIAPHSACGFGGGGKIVLPGVAGEQTTLAMHSLARQVRERVGFLRGVRDNPVRELIDAVAMQAGLSYIVNLVQNQHGHVVDCVSGHPVEAHKRGARVANEVFGTRIPERFPVVVVEAFPADIDLWQAGKAIESAAMVCEPGGSIILVSSCPDGVSPEHPVLLDLAGVSAAEADGLVRRGLVSDAVGVSALHGYRRFTEQFSLTLVSEGVHHTEAAKLGMGCERTLQVAVDRALEHAGPGARVAIIRTGGEILPIVSD